MQQNMSATDARQSLSGTSEDFFRISRQVGPSLAAHMSDDWSDDDDGEDHGAPIGLPKASDAISSPPAEALDVPSPSTSPAPVPAPGPAQQSVLLCLPAQIFPVATSNSAIVVGFTILYDSSTRTPLILEAVPAASSLRRGKARQGLVQQPPFDFALVDAQPGFAALVDRMGRSWRVQFRSRPEALRLLTVLTIAGLCAKQGADQIPYFAVDVLRGSVVPERKSQEKGKQKADKDKEKVPTLGGKHFGQVMVSAHWLSLSPNQHQQQQQQQPLCLPSASLLETFDPPFGALAPGVVAMGAESGVGVGAQGWCAVRDLRGADVSDTAANSGMPASLAEALARTKLGGHRLILTGSWTDLGRDIVNKCGASLSVYPSGLGLGSGGGTGLIVAMCALMGVSKKRLYEKPPKDIPTPVPAGLPAHVLAQGAAQGSAHQSSVAIAGAGAVPAASSLAADNSAAAGSHLPAPVPAPAPTQGPAPVLLPSPTPTPPHPSAVPPSPVPSPAAAFVPAPMPASPRLEALAALLAQLPQLAQAAEQHGAALSSTQSKICKFALNGMFAGVLADLGLSDPPPDQPAHVLTPDQDQHKAALRTRMLSVLEDFTAKNTAETSVKGTIRNTTAAIADLTGCLGALMGPDGAGCLDYDRQLELTQAEHLAHQLHAYQMSQGQAQLQARAQAQAEVVAARAGEAAAASEVARLRSALAAAEGKVAALQTQLSQQGERALTLASEHLDMAERLKQAEQAHQEASKQAAMLPVFESGLTDLRRVLDSEAQEKQKAQESLQHLLQFQSKFKLTWLPDKGLHNCMLCHDKFRVFGAKSKHHCRFCGRVFCKECCTHMELPEFGFSGKVLVCRACHDFKTQINGPSAGAGAGEADGDAEED